jgi:hypothetical protein
MNDYRISVEEFESQAETLEMIRKLVRDTMEQAEGFEESKQTPLTLTEEKDVPLLNYFIQL